MTSQEQHQYMSWCWDKEIKVYPVTEFDYQHRKLLISLNKDEIGKEVYKMRRESLLTSTMKSEQLHIAVQRKNKVSIGEKLFKKQTINKGKIHEKVIYENKENNQIIKIEDQINLIYKLLYEKENNNN